MSGCIVYQKLIRSVRSCYRTCGDTELEIKRRFYLSAQYHSAFKKSFTFRSLKDFTSKKKIWENLKFQCNEKLAVLGEILTKQCNFVASQRLRRMSQIWNLYTHLYSESTIRFMVSQFVRKLRAQKRPFSVLFGAALFSWERDKITDDEIERYNTNHILLV